MALQEVAFVDSVGQLYDSVSATFAVVSASGWPPADTGQVWTVSSSSEVTSSGGKGLMSLASVGSSRTARLSTPGTDMVVYAEAAVPVVPTGGNITIRLAGRGTTFTDIYEAWLEIVPTTGAATIRLRKTVASTGTFLTSGVSCGTHAAGNTWAVKLSIVGASLQAKAWNKTTASEPVAYQTAAFDFDLTSGVEASCLARLETGNTNTLPVSIAWDNFSVTSPSQTRLNLHDLATIITTSDTDWGMPEFDRAVVSNLLADDAITPASAYGPRQIVLALDFPETDEDLVASRVQAVIREINRAKNLIRWKPPGASNPVWWQTRRSAPSDIRWDSLHQAKIPIWCKPFALGPRVDLAPVVVSNDPAAVSNGMYIDISGVQGDVETPTLIRLTTAAPFTGGILYSVLSTRRRGTPANMPMIQQCESMTLGTDTTLPGNDAVMSGSGSNYARVSFATVTALDTRVSLANFPAVPTNDARGRYRVWLRNRQNTAGDLITMRLKVGAPGITTNITNDTVTLPQSTNRRWTDLGEITIPLWADPVEDGLSGVEMPPVGLGLSIDVGRVGSGTVDLDTILLMPADDQAAMINWALGAAGIQTPQYMVLDDVHDMLYPMDAGPLMHSDNKALGRSGAFPKLAPGVTNRILLLTDANPRGVFTMADDKTWTITAQVSYWPQYLYVRPVGS